MNSFRQRVPNYIDAPKPDPHVFNTLEELYADPHINNYMSKPDFSHLAIDGDYLMAIFDEGYKWWVLGFIENPDDIDIPKWEKALYEVQMPNGTVTILTNKDVRRTIGADVHLYDGTIAKNLRY